MLLHTAVYARVSAANEAFATARACSRRKRPAPTEAAPPSGRHGSTRRRGPVRSGQAPAR